MGDCCARLRSKLTMNQEELRSAARRAAIRSSQGLSIEKSRVKIREVKAAIKVDQQNIVDHEAMHAGEAVA